MFCYVSTIPLTELELFIKCNDSTFGRHESEHHFFRIYTFLEFSFYFICNQFCATRVPTAVIMAPVGMMENVCAKMDISEVTAPVS